MADSSRDFQDERAVKQAETEQAETEHDQHPIVSPATATAMLGAPMAAVQRRALVQSVAQNFGNAQVQRMLSKVQRAASGTLGRSAASGPGGGALEEDLANAVQEERSKGQPLPEATRGSVERSLGHDMSQLRVSVNPDLNAAMGAKAFTSGQNVVLRDSADMSDMSLLTHEATHAIQQGFSTARPSSIGGADTEHEHAAENNAANASAAPAGVQREAAEEELAMSRDTTVARAEEDELAMMRDPSIMRAEEDELQMSRDTTVERAGEEEELAMLRDPAVQREGEEEELG